MNAWRVILILAVVGAPGLVVAKDKPPAKKASAAESHKPSAPAAAPADDKAEAGSAAGQAEADGTGEAPLANIAHIVGPKVVSLGHGAQISLPAGMNLIERAQAQELLRRQGDNVDNVAALVVPPSDSPATWLVVIAAYDVGYVSDGDANDLDADTMLDQFKQATIEQNKKRVSLGVSELFVDGWSERPRYEAATHHLVWGLNGHDKEGKVVNFFTRFLGRNGYLSVNLIDDPAKIEASKVQALSVLGAIGFLPGQRYDDHESSDRDSGIGLKALVIGGTGVVIAKKTGLLVAIALFLKKGFVVVIAAIGGFFRWLFRRKKQEPEVVSNLGPTDPPAGG